ncbi:MAG: HlyC/CorC family transporter [Gammaproteobacteria bacterium]
MSQFQILLFSIVLILLILLAAFFSCAETSLMAVNRYRLRHKARLKKRYAIRLLQLLKRPDRLLGAILIGNTFANMLASSLATLIAFHFWGDKGALLAAVLLAFVVLIFSEIAPKTIAAIYPDKVAQLVAYPIQIVLRILYPAVWVANAITNYLLRLLHIRVTNYASEPVSREELRSIVYDTTGKMSRQYQNMLLGILDLNKLTVNDIMLPQHEIKGIDIEAPWEKIVTQIKKINQDWVPFYREEMNHVIGVLYTRDVMRVLLSKKDMNKELLQQFLHEPYFVPEGTLLNIQLGYFQQSQEKIAFIVDEYGEIKGLLTLNAILEEIVGDFTSSVNAMKRVQLQEDSSYLVEGTVVVRDFNRSTHWTLPSNGPRTINGLIIEHLKRCRIRGRRC